MEAAGKAAETRAERLKCETLPLPRPPPITQELATRSSTVSPRETNLERRAPGPLSFGAGKSRKESRPPPRLSFLFSPFLTFSPSQADPLRAKLRKKSRIGAPGGSGASPIRPYSGSLAGRTPAPPPACPERKAHRLAAAGTNHTRVGSSGGGAAGEEGEPPPFPQGDGGVSSPPAPAPAPPQKKLSRASFLRAHRVPSARPPQAGAGKESGFVPERQAWLRPKNEPGYLDVLRDKQCEGKRFLETPAPSAGLTGHSFTSPAQSDGQHRRSSRDPSSKNRYNLWSPGTWPVRTVPSSSPQTAVLGGAAESDGPRYRLERCPRCGQASFDAPAVRLS